MNQVNFNFQGNWAHTKFRNPFIPLTFYTDTLKNTYTLNWVPFYLVITFTNDLVNITLRQKIIFVFLILYFKHYSVNIVCHWAVTVTGQCMCACCPLGLRNSVISPMVPSLTFYELIKEKSPFLINRSMVCVSNTDNWITNTSISSCIIMSTESYLGWSGWATHTILCQGERTGKVIITIIVVIILMINNCDYLVATVTEWKRS